MTTAVAAARAHPPAHEHPNQFALLKQRRFAPFFWTQFSATSGQRVAQGTPCSRPSLKLSCAVQGGQKESG